MDHIKQKHDFITICRLFSFSWITFIGEIMWLQAISLSSQRWEKSVDFFAGKKVPLDFVYFSALFRHWTECHREASLNIASYFRGVFFSTVSFFPHRSKSFLFICRCFKYKNILWHKQTKAPPRRVKKLHPKQQREKGKIVEFQNKKKTKPHKTWWRWI